MTRTRDTLSRIDDAIARFEQALKALRQIPRDSHGIALNGIEHELIPLLERLRTLREEVTGAGDRAQ
jgi:hypothetical protein